MSHTPIRYAVTIFSGFLQKLGSPGSGLVAVEQAAHDLCVGHAEMRVRLYPWHTNAGDVAESIWRFRPRGEERFAPQVHLVVGYSYGGDRAVKFCRELQFRGDCVVRRLFLCDPVRRWDRMPGVAASFGVGKLRVPKNVSRCTVVRQCNPRWSACREEGGVFQPAGHPVVVESRSTILDDPSVRDCGHVYIDDDPEFSSLVLAEVRALVEENVQRGPSVRCEY